MAYRTPAGRRKNVSSRTTDKNKALQMALKLEAAGGEIGNRADAEKLVDEILKFREIKLRDETPSQQFFHDYFETQCPNWSESSTKSFRAIQNQWVARYGDMPLGRIEHPQWRSIGIHCNGSNVHQ